MVKSVIQKRNIFGVLIERKWFFSKRVTKPPPPPGRGCGKWSMLIILICMTLSCSINHHRNRIKHQLCLSTIGVPIIHLSAHQKIPSYFTFNAYRRTAHKVHPCTGNEKHCWNISIDISKCAPPEPELERAEYVRWKRAISHPLCSLAFFVFACSGYVQSSLPNVSINQNCQWTKSTKNSIDLLPSDDAGGFHLIRTCDMERNSFRRCQRFECRKKTKIDLMYTYVYYREHQFSSHLLNSGCWHIFISVCVCCASNSQNKLRMNGKDALLTAQQKNI